MSCLSLHLLWNMVMQIVVRSVCTSGEGRASQSYVTSKAWRRNSTPIEAAIKTSPCLTLSSPGRVKLRRGGLERFWKYPNLFRRQNPHRKKCEFTPCVSLFLIQILFCPCHIWCYPWMSVPCFFAKQKEASRLFSWNYYLVKRPTDWVRTGPNHQNHVISIYRLSGPNDWDFGIGKKWCRCKSWFIAGSKLDICNIGSGSKVSLAKMDGFRIAT